MLDELQKWICSTVGPTVAALFEPLVHYQNVASLSLFFIGINLVDGHFIWISWFYFLCFW